VEARLRTDGLLAGREASELLQGALAKLSPDLRETVILRDLEELNTGKSPRCSRCRRAR